eukprot:9266547-Alexandrium_andersonii.AAC.1
MCIRDRPGPAGEQHASQQPQGPDPLAGPPAPEDAGPPPPPPVTQAAPPPPPLAEHPGPTLDA